MELQNLLLQFVVKWFKLKTSDDGLDNAIAFILFPFVVCAVFVIVRIVGNEVIDGYNVTY